MTNGKHFNLYTTVICHLSRDEFVVVCHAIRLSHPPENRLCSALICITLSNRPITPPRLYQRLWALTDLARCTERQIDQFRQTMVCPAVRLSLLWSEQQLYLREWQLAWCPTVQLPSAADSRKYKYLWKYLWGLISYDFVKGRSSLTQHR